MDCSIVPLREGYSLVSTTDYFYPLVEDPFMQGMIGCANVLSDLYAMGVENCDNMLMILASPLDMQPDHRKIITRKMIEGFNYQVKIAGTRVTGGQTVLNPWPIIGGMATSSCKDTEFIRPVHAKAGDVIVLTKALGTQIAVNVHQWIEQKDEKTLKQIENVITIPQGIEAYEKAMFSMARLNRTGARLMNKYKARGATDVTGFGIIGHAGNLASNQLEAVDFKIHTLPIIQHMKAVNDVINFQLMEGFSAETSGGLLTVLPAENVKDFCEEIEKIDGCPAWVVGSVLPREKSENRAYLADDLKVIEV